MFNFFKKPQRPLHISTPRDNPNLGHTPPTIIYNQDILNARKYNMLFKNNYTKEQNILYQKLQMNCPNYIYSQYNVYIN